MLQDGHQADLLNRLTYLSPKMAAGLTYLCPKMTTRLTYLSPKMAAGLTYYTRHSAL